MTLAERLDSLARGWRGPLLAALVTLVAALPGVLRVPPIDRDESRFAEASAQMLESGDYVTIHFQDTPRFKKPVGIYWLQAGAVAAFSHVEDRAIWAYRLPSLLGAMLAAAACAWGAAAFIGRGGGLLAGALLGASFLLTTEANLAATDAVLAGAVTLTMAALGRLYLAARGGPATDRWTRTLMWAGLSLSVLVKGPIGPMVFALTLLALAVCDRKAAWMKRLGWGWGLILLLAVVGPWAMAITVATDGAFWGAAVGGDLAPKLAGGQEGHGAPPGYYALLTPITLFPAALLAPAGAVLAWRRRAEPLTRFALCWLIPAWLVFELTPTKLIHYTLPLYGALAWLMAAAALAPMGRAARLAGAALLLLGAAVLALAGPLAMARLADWRGAGWDAAAAALFIACAGAGVAALRRPLPSARLLTCGALAVAGHTVLFGAVLPSLAPLWLSARAARALEIVGVSPRNGVTQGPVTVAGYEEPSIVFLLGADTELGDGDDAAAAIAEGRPAIVEAREEAAFRAGLAERGRGAARVGVGAGLDYSNNRRDTLSIYRPLPPPGPAPGTRTPRTP